MSAPWNNGLPVALKVGGEDRPIRSDYRAVLDIFLALTDPELDAENRILETLDILYEDELPPELWQEALDKALWFVRGGQEEQKQGNKARLVSWEQDFPYIASPISKSMGNDIRGMEYLHWWTFLSEYMSIGDCYFAEIVRIRDKKARGKPLDKADREFYRRNREAVDIKKPLTDAEQEILKEWM